tara:strand:+ start:29805 stop:30134 length:330 start_codon:yes stop_codon:yes gene_type:complete
MDHNKKGLKEKPSEVFEIVWSKIPITIKYTPNYWESVKVDHLEVKAAEPLPFTETGYRSAWLLPGQLDGRTPVEYVMQALEEDSKTKKWKSYLEEKKVQELKRTQMSLF